MLNRSVRLAVCAAMAGFICFVQSPAMAGIIGTDLAQAGQDRERLRAFVARDDAAKQLQSLGVAPESVQGRVDAMTDAEVQLIAGKIDSLPAGGALSENQWIWVIGGILLLLLII